ncbi:MAG: hypothetical protein MJ093_02900 [Saccharofermentans sp.]|nr:hypothetical protein [Saccharofermentans sp.]
MRKVAKVFLMVLIVLAVLLVVINRITYYMCTKTLSNLPVTGASVIKALDEQGINSPLVNEDGLIIFEQYYFDGDPKNNYHISGRYEVCDDVEEAGILFDDILLESRRLNHQDEIDICEFPYYQMAKCFFVETDRSYTACYQSGNKVFFISASAMEESDNSLPQAGIDSVKEILNSLEMPLHDSPVIFASKTILIAERFNHN